MNTQEKLDRLAELDAHRDTILVDVEALKQQIIPAEVKQQLRDIDEEYDSKLEAISQERSQLELEVRDEVMVAGEWDTKALDGYAVAHPEIAQFKKLGAPSVRISNA